MDCRAGIKAWCVGEDCAWTSSSCSGRICAGREPDPGQRCHPRAYNLALGRLVGSGQDAHSGWSARHRATLADAKRFLTDLLADGPLPTKTIKADADGAGYSWATIRRAQKALGIEPAKEGMKAGWVWRMPWQEAAKAIPENAKMLKNAEDAQQKEVSTFGEIEHLRNDSGVVEVEI